MAATKSTKKYGTLILRIPIMLDEVDHEYMEAIGDEMILHAAKTIAAYAKTVPVEDEDIKLGEAEASLE